MKQFKTIFSLFCSLAVVAALSFFVFQRVSAQSCSDIGDINQRIQCYETELSRLSDQSKTLSNQIAQFDAQIRLTTLKISQTEEKIVLLGGRIERLEGSLEALTAAFSSRVVETYKMTRLGDTFLTLISAPNLSETISRFHYLQKIQEADRDLLTRLQTAQNTYKTEKTDQETLQTELAKQKANLNNQKAAKAALLAVTKNDEKRYQQLLSEARAELAITLGYGSEKYLRDVSEGDTIGYVIKSASGCSTGQHLHFEVHSGSSFQDPNNYLKSISFNYADGYNQSYYGAISPHGSWNWPLNDTVTINQGYGATGYARDFGYANGIHTGIDMVNQNNQQVKAVKAGKLYGGSYTCKGSLAGTLLFAKVEQADGITSWYLHMTPQ